MPHCATCDRFYNPNSLTPDGACPTCGRQVAEPAVAGLSEAERPVRAPWHFKALLGVTVVYLGYRLVQGLAWVGHHL